MNLSQREEIAFKAIDSFRIEVPSWAFSNSGTRFAVFTQPGAAVSTEQKLSDAGQVHRLTGCCPTIAVHVLWDFPNGKHSAAEVATCAQGQGIQIGAINPTLFQDQIYKHGSLANPCPSVRQAALNHILDSIEISQLTGSRDISLWFADGSSYPGTANIRHRRQWFIEGLTEAHRTLKAGQRLLIEYKPWEPAFYHTDIGDWGMSMNIANAVGPQAKVLVDTGHHYHGQNIEQIVAWLLATDMLGGFHLNDRRYADDDLTLGSIDPYQVFRIFHEILYFEWEQDRRADIAYMIDQSHNLKDKIEEMIQTAMMAQELYAKAAMVDHEALAVYQAKAALIDAEECLKAAFATDVRPMLRGWRRSKGLPEDPLKGFRESGYGDRISRERAASSRTAVLA